MSSRYEAWANRPVSRDHLGRFAESAASHAARLLADAAVPGRSVSKMFREGARPEGFEHLSGRSGFLWDIPTRRNRGGLGRSRTDEEQEELNLIDAAVAKYYDSIGLRGEGPMPYRRKFEGEFEVFGPHGDVIETEDPNAPRAAQFGYKFLGVGEDGREMWAKPGVSPYREIFDRNGRHRDPYDSPYDPRGRRSRGQKEGRIDMRTAMFARDEYGEEAYMFTRRASTGKEKPGAIGGRGNLETDFRSAMKYVDPVLNKRLREGKGKKKRARTWIEKLNVRMERGEA